MTIEADQIPVVELDDLGSHNTARRERATSALRRAFGEFGLVYVRGHGIESAALDDFYSAFLDFTARPEAEKARVARPDIWYQRGWTPPNTEKAVIAGGQPDFKECYFAAPEPFDPIARVQYPQIFADNVWPENASGFKDGLLSLGHSLHEVGMKLLRGGAVALGLPPYGFEELVYGGPHVTRALRYLPLRSEQVNTGILWGEEHTDFNLLTLLPGGHFFDPAGAACRKPDEESGLWLRTRATPSEPKGRMVAGRAPDGCVVAQVGQQLEILTGGTFLATPHVIRAPGTPGYSRTAVAHFIHARSMAVLFPMEPFRSDDVLAAYSPPVLAGTYGTKTLVDIGLAPVEALNQLGYRHYDRLDGQRNS